MVGFLLKLSVKNTVCQNHSDVDPLFASGVEETGSLVSGTAKQNLNKGWTKAWWLQVNKLAQWGKNGVRAALALRMYQFTRFNKAMAFSSAVEGPDIVLAMCLQKAVWDFLGVKGPWTLQPEDLCGRNTYPGYTFSSQDFLCSHEGYTEKFLV